MIFVFFFRIFTGSTRLDGNAIGKYVHSVKKLTFGLKDFKFEL